MKITLRATRCAAAIVAVAATSTTLAFDRSGGGRYIRDFDRAGGNHYILCFHCEAAADVPIGRPNGITTDVAGNVYFSSTNIVYKLDRVGDLIRVAGDGTPGYSGDGGLAVDARLNIPLDNYREIEKDFIDYVPLVGGLVVDASGNLYIADAYNNRIRKVDTDGIITTAPGGTPSQMAWPQGVAADPGGNLYVSSGWGPLNKVSLDGNVTTLATANCGPGFKEPGFCVPEQIALDRAGNVYVPDGYCRVRKVSADGGIVTVAGNERPDPPGWAFTCGYSGDGGPAIGAALSNMPYGVAVDGDGTLFIADTYNHCIRKVDGAGVINTVAGRCMSAGYSGDGGPSTGATLNTPMGVAVDATGNLYIADTENHRIRKIAPGGIITTVAGNGNL